MALTLLTAESAPDIRTAAVTYLRTHRAWYVRWSRFYTIAWNTVTILIIILGALSSILTAAGDPFVPKTVLIILPAASSLLAAVLVHFKLKERCQLREEGRIAIEDLIAQAHLIPTNDPTEALKAAIELRLKAHQIERDQLVEFIARVSKDKTLQQRREVLAPDSGESAG